MTTARKEFERQGKLYLSRNPSHSFTIGPLLFQWCWADSWCWSELTDSGTLQNYALSIGTVERVDGLKAYKFCCWKLLVFVGVLK